MPVAIVTGAARGLGRATAVRLATGGWQVVLVDACADDPAVPYALATRADLDDAVAAAGGDGQAEGVVGDVRHDADLEGAVAAAVERFGGLDASVAAAGVIVGAPSAWTTEEQAWRAVVDVDLTGVWRLARAAIPAMLERPPPRQGRFVAVSSTAGLVGLPQLAAYSAAKHGVIGLVRSLAAELGDSGITANAVCPGSMGTAMLAATAPLYGLASASEFSQHHPLGRLLDVDEVAAAIAWLCSPESSGTTGAVLPVDAGMTATR